jgi:hypothetical protein
MIGLIEHIEAPEAVVGEFRKGFQAHAALAAVRQAKINEASRALESRLVDGIGQLSHRVDADVYWLARHKFGPNCWSDPAFLRDCEKNGMVQRVAGRSDRVMVDLGRNIPIKPAASRRVDFGMKPKDGALIV